MTDVQRAADRGRRGVDRVDALWGAERSNAYVPVCSQASLHWPRGRRASGARERGAGRARLGRCSAPALIARLAASRDRSRPPAPPPAGGRSGRPGFCECSHQVLTLPIVSAYRARVVSVCAVRGDCGEGRGVSRKDGRGGYGLSVFAKKLLGVGRAIVVLGVLIGLYVANWATSFPTTGGLDQLAGRGRRQQPDARDGRRGRPQVQPRASELGLLPGEVQRQVGAQHHLPGAREHGRARDDLPVRLTEGLRNPFLSQVQGTVGGTETIDGKTAPGSRRRSLPHVRRAGTRRVRAAARRAGRSQETVRRAPCEPVETITARSRSASAPARRAVTGGRPRSMRRRLHRRQRRPNADLGYISGFIDSSSAAR